MANEGQVEGGGLDAIASAVKRAGAKGLPPVHLWNPPDCGDIDMRIAADGTWFYQKTPIGRPALVRLFASVLKRENGKYFLVTPVEKCGIAVDDVRFWPSSSTSSRMRGSASCIFAPMSTIGWLVAPVMRCASSPRRRAE